MRVQRVLAVAVVLLFLVGLGFGQSKRRTEPIQFTYESIGEKVCSCGGFDVLLDYVVLVRGMLIYDKDGVAVQSVETWKVLGQDTYYNSENHDLFLLGGPGEVNHNRWDYRDGLYTNSGIPFKVRVPGYGSIFYETGRMVFNISTWEVLVNAGHNEYIDADVDALCRFLTPIP
jgi:hypothetical protein